MTLHLTLDSNTEFLRAIDLWQTPISALLPFWEGEQTEFATFCKAHRLYWHNVATIDEAKRQAADVIEQMNALFKREIGRFDFRLATAFSTRGLSSIADVEIAHLHISLHDCNDQEIAHFKQIFSELSTRSFLDFRSLGERSVELYYSRRGYYEHDSKLTIHTAKQAYSLKDNFKNPKDNNFILSGICLELAHQIPHLSLRYTYTNGMGGKVDCELSGEDILQATEQKKQQTIARADAKAELQKEAQKTRVSLPPESIEERLQNTPQQIRFAPNDDIEGFFERNYEAYKRKEEEKCALRLQKAHEQALNAYDYLHTQLESGITIKEALELVKQKYRDDDTTNLASLLLTKDLLNIAHKDSEILALKEQCAQHKQTLAEYRETIAKREETIGTLRATISEKVNEHNLYKEKAEQLLQQSLDELTERLQKDIDNLGALLAQKESELDEQGTLIDRLSIENGFLKERCGELKETIAKYESRMDNLQDEMKGLLRGGEQHIKKEKQ